MEQLSGAHDSREEAFRAGVLAIRQASDVMKPESNVRTALTYYVPLRASTTSQPSKPDDYFDLLEKVEGQLSDNQLSLGSDPLYILLQGTAGSGKSLFMRRLELKLWQARDADDTAAIPLFISLPALMEPRTDAVREALRGAGLSENVIEQLRQEAHFVFLLDGFDELGLAQNLYTTNRLHEWRAHVYIGARSQFLLSLSDYKSLFMHPMTKEMAEVRHGSRTSFSAAINSSCVPHQYSHAHPPCSSHPIFLFLTSFTWRHSIRRKSLVSLRCMCVAARLKSATMMPVTRVS